MSFEKSANYVYVKHTVCVNSKMVVEKLYKQTGS